MKRPEPLVKSSGSPLKGLWKMGVKFYPRIQVRGMVHSKNTVEEITLVESLGGNKYIVLTKDGVMCSAIFNIFIIIIYKQKNRV